jgi:CRISPR-associated protein Csm4
MKTYCFKLTPLSSWGTPWHADTLFGALCWQCRFLDGESALRGMLQRFRDGDPPFILSDVFPEGWFPCPLSLNLRHIPDSNLQRKLPAWISEDKFRLITQKTLELIPETEWPEPLEYSRTLHAAIGRHSGTTGGTGQLFEVDSAHLSNSLTKRLSLFVRTEEPERVHRLLRGLSASGFGKKRSSGHGAFSVEQEPEICDWMDGKAGGNAFVALSHFIPSENDPTDGKWRLLTKYPKFASGVPAESPYKGRFVMLRPGAVFKTAGSVRPFYGTMVTEISQRFPVAVHYALCFPVSMQGEEKDIGLNA